MQLSAYSSAILQNNLKKDGTGLKRFFLIGTMDSALALNVQAKSLRTITKALVMDLKLDGMRLLSKWIRMVITMRVVDKIEELKEEIESLTEKYCENCQEFTCDYCWARIEGDENVRDD